MNIQEMATVVVAIATVVLAIITYFYACSTRKLARLAKEQMRLTREQMQEAQRPILSLKLQEEKSGRDRLCSALQAQGGEFSERLEWVISNVGPGPALNVKYQIRGVVLNQEPIVLAVGASSGPYNLSLEQSAQPDERRVTVTYEDVYRRTFESARQVSLNRATQEHVVGPLATKKIPG